MRLVKVTFPYQKVYFWHLNHSAPNRTHQWGNIKFEFDPECKDCDAWVVWQSHKGLTEAETVNCPPNNTIKDKWEAIALVRNLILYGSVS
ncbi:MAG: hypothetical protein ACLFTJ_07355 [Halothece sp.]